MSTFTPLEPLQQVGQRGSASSISGEEHVIGEDDAQTVWLKEFPDSSVAVVVTGTPPGGAGSYSDVSPSAPAASGEFRVNDTIDTRLAQALEFHSSDEGGSISVAYDGLGGTALARDHNRLRTLILALGTMPWHADPTGSEDARSSLNDAVTRAASGGGTILITGQYRVASNLTFPSTVRLLFANGGKLLPDTGVTLTYECEIQAPDRMEAFAGNGTHDLSDARVPYVSTEWFAGSDIGARTNNAIAAVGGTTLNRRFIIQFPRGKHTLSTSINADATSQLTFRGWGRMNTHIECAGSLSIIAISLVTSDECECRDFRMTEASGSIVSTLIQMTGTSCRLSNLFIGNASVGIQLGDGASAAGAIGEFDHIIVESCKNNWIIEGSTRNCTFTSCFGNAGNSVATTDAEFWLREAGGQSPSFLTFQGCKAEQGSGWGWLVEGSCRHIRWLGCQVRDMDLGGIKYVTDLVGGVPTGGHGTIIGCDFEDNAVVTTSPAIQTNILKLKVQSCTLRDNGTQMQGIDLTADSDLCKVNGNTYQSVASFNVQDNGTRNEIDGVTEVDLGGAAGPNPVSYQAQLVYDTDAAAGTPAPRLFFRRPEDAGYVEITLA